MKKLLIAAFLTMLMLPISKSANAQCFRHHGYGFCRPVVRVYAAPVFLPPPPLPVRIVYQPQRIWVEGHWYINRRGYERWAPGYWTWR